MWVIIKYDGDDVLYATVPGSHKSYSPDIRKARRFVSKAKANQNKCGNETVVTVESQLT